MTITEIRSQFHTLIDEVDNPQLLERFMEILRESAAPKKGKIWDTLSEEGKRGVMEAYEQSKDKANLVSNEEVMKKYSKWLKK